MMIHYPNEPGWSMTEETPLLPVPIWAPAQCYGSMHWRLRQCGGPASDYGCADCGQEAAEWSLDTLDGVVWDEKWRCYWSPDLASYVPRCKPCHGRQTVIQRIEMRARGMMRSDFLRLGLPRK